MSRRSRPNSIRRSDEIHSIEYRNAAQVQPGGVLVVGAGNSGTDIALELAREHEVWLSGRHPGQLPFAIRQKHGTTAVAGRLLRVQTRADRADAAGT